MLDPLFIPTREALLQRLKLSGAGDADVQAVIDQAIRQVRVGFLQRLGTTRTAEVVAYNHADVPATDNEFMRARAEQAEEAWVRWKLLMVLPTIWMEAQGSTRDRWNEEPLTRDISREMFNDELARLSTLVEEILAELGGAPDDKGINAFVIGPTTKNVDPGNHLLLSLT